MSENLKLRRDATSGEAVSDRLPRSPDPASSSDLPAIDDAESQMRKALGLLGETPRHRSDSERTDQPSRTGGDRFNTGLHRRRFVQDGDIPVTVLRRDQGHEPPVHRGVGAAQPPTSSRLQRTEAALAAETSARERAERLLGETQAAARDLQTKIGHAELAKNEAVEALRRDREALVQLRADSAAQEARLQEALEQLRLAEANAQEYQAQIFDERQARKTAEKTLHDAEAARDAAQSLVRTLSQERPAPVQPADPPRRRAEPLHHAVAVADPKVATAPVARRIRSKQAAAVEPEPVKWWLNPKPVAKKR